MGFYFFFGRRDPHIAGVIFRGGFRPLARLKCLGSELSVVYAQDIADSMIEIIECTI